MRLPIVDNAERPVELDWLRISRLDPVAPTHQRVEVRRDERDRGRLVRARPDGGPDEGGEQDDQELDAQLAGELVSAVRTLLERDHISLDAAPAGDGLRYELEVSWGGVVHRYDVDGEPTDDALQGVLGLATSLLGADPHVTGASPSQVGDPAGASEEASPDAGIVVLDITTIDRPHRG